MPRLFSYCIPYDSGAAPNPFWGICTLVICKPGIRRVAKKNDWIVGTGSRNYDFQGKLVYAMEVSEVMKMEEYDSFCKKNLPRKIPNWNSKNYKDKVGDCIYDFSKADPAIRKSVHSLENRDTDLNGVNALLSDHFYYFGRNPIELPDSLKPIVLQSPGHKSNANNPYVEEFIDWISEFRSSKNKVNNNPFLSEEFELNNCFEVECAKRDKITNQEDEKIGECN